MPLAPSLFCTTISGLPAICLTMCLASSRPSTSVGPPGAKLIRSVQPLALVERLLGARSGGAERERGGNDDMQRP